MERCAVTKRIANDQVAGKTTSAVALAFVRHTCPCTKCRERRIAEKTARPKNS